jgi:hypothetical protein
VTVGDVRVLELVVGVDAEADRECARRTVADAGELARNRRAVEAAAQERAGRAVRARLAHRGLERGVQLVAQRLERISAALDEARSPVREDFGTAVDECQRSRRPQLVNALVDRVGRRDHVHHQKVVQTLAA